MDLPLLIATSAIVALTHTLAGPDHYVPFIALAKAGNWSYRRTALTTFFCGIGHLASAGLLGLLGITLGFGVSRLTGINSIRGSIAAWLLIGFGLAYAAWGVRKALRPRVTHEHGDAEHVHGHGHVPHSHSQGPSPAGTTGWVLFLIFVFGPCEPMIPLVLYPIARGEILATVLVTLTFSIITLATMMAVVLAAVSGLARIQSDLLERYSHVIAGVTIALCGGAIEFLGL